MAPQCRSRSWAGFRPCEVIVGTHPCRQAFAALFSVRLSRASSDAVRPAPWAMGWPHPPISSVLAVLPRGEARRKKDALLRSARRKRLSREKQGFAAVPAGAGQAERALSSRWRRRKWPGPGAPVGRPGRLGFAAPRALRPTRAARRKAVASGRPEHAYLQKGRDFGHPLVPPVPGDSAQLLHSSKARRAFAAAGERRKSPVWRENAVGPRNFVSLEHGRRWIGPLKGAHCVLNTHKQRMDVCCVVALTDRRAPAPIGLPGASKGTPHPRSRAPNGPAAAGSQDFLPTRAASAWCNRRRGVLRLPARRIT